MLLCCSCFNEKACRWHVHTLYSNNSNTTTWLHSNSKVFFSCLFSSASDFLWNGKCLGPYMLWGRRERSKGQRYAYKGLFWITVVGKCDQLKRRECKQNTKKLLWLWREICLQAKIVYIYRWCFFIVCEKNASVELVGSCQRSHRKTAEETTCRDEWRRAEDMTSRRQAERHWELRIEMLRSGIRFAEAWNETSEHTEGWKTSDVCMCMCVNVKMCECVCTSEGGKERGRDGGSAGGEKLWQSSDALEKKNSATNLRSLPISALLPLMNKWRIINIHLCRKQ